MTIEELQEYAITLGVGIMCENENQELVTAILEGIVTTEIQIVNFTGF